MGDRKHGTKIHLTTNMDDRRDLETTSDLVLGMTTTVPQTQKLGIVYHARESCPPDTWRTHLPCLMRAQRHLSVFSSVSDFPTVSLLFHAHTKFDQSEELFNTHTHTNTNTQRLPAKRNGRQTVMVHSVVSSNSCFSGRSYFC